MIRCRSHNQRLILLCLRRHILKKSRVRPDIDVYDMARFARVAPGSMIEFLEGNFFTGDMSELVWSAQSSRCWRCRPSYRKYRAVQSRAHACPICIS
ncbi:hypothetical protein GJA_1685 [Janthinobacterium agaricidamnosum NBRC 102515 = DSM 9628]|uniref:Uncharacterized protein n=1 Tax=Janthinobacterium agaricidamnosum NBRC 102515 = DSM 9628 TaxID=1349767 RepID=W0V4X4_9BURK|nr:hypothetical protein GJA_1685 [Janthinobacterium agaricidamnosum NBRC 102515 = DSM 9628]